MLTNGDSHVLDSGHFLIYFKASFREVIGMKDTVAWLLRMILHKRGSFLKPIHNPTSPTDFLQKSLRHSGLILASSGLVCHDMHSTIASTGVHTGWDVKRFLGVHQGLIIIIVAGVRLEAPILVYLCANVTQEPHGVSVLYRQTPIRLPYRLFTGRSEWPTSRRPDCCSF